MLDKPMTMTRRGLFAAGAGLVIAFHLAPLGKAQAAARTVEGIPAGAPGSFAANAFVHIAPDDTVTVLSKHIEMGQGPYTGLTTIVAEELDADWSQMRAEASPADDEIYKNLAFGIQGTGGSTAIANSYEQLRKAGATARAMLVEAAARQWNVPASEITVVKGRVRHAPSNRESGFGALAKAASGITPPAEPKLKDPADFTLIGSDIKRLDSAAKSDGTAVFTIDVTLPGMLTALVVHADYFGATVARFDDKAARAVKGVVDIKPVPAGVAVYAETMWAALKARDVLEIEWDLSKAETRSSAEIIADYEAKAKSAGFVVTSAGDVAKASDEAEQVIEADYVFPYLAHAPMEPLDAVFVKAADGSIDIYSGAQFPTSDKAVTAKILGLKPEQVRVNVQFAGGSFGRRAQAGSPYAIEAAEVFKASGGDRPLKHLWLREDDIRGGYYRPIYVHRLRGTIGADKSITSWQQVVVGQSIITGTPFEAMMGDGYDPTSVEGASDLAYAVPHRQVSLHTTKVDVPVLWWRSVGHTHTGFTTEAFMDELLAAAGKDAVEGRLALLGEQPRHAGVLKRVAEIADWGGPVPAGRARGVAVHKSFDTYVAQIAEISQGENGLPRVHKVWCAVDCGVPVNPTIIRGQMEGGIGFGLGAMLFSEITLGEGGRIVQSNFHDYRSLRIDEMPEVEVAIMDSREKPTGVGEPGVPPIGPAVANAWRVLTGKPVRRLPMLPPVDSRSLS
ncbi:isoquinoline 1-oxidoreductase beta subunit [Rhodoligotrophos appendicifer]|uniref:xanthine dehydrogenase family protein molybdopterin-binding subunit n=1 Tax=Rhodoligotrophos appendicifer TaxID=987056 RepID=UPI001185D0D1|nr:xanthine dehydrogenase family protein molybdopterin-binding subunit [Rhodoligotrophos appendicifer]